MHTHTPTHEDWLKFIRSQGTATLEFISDWIAGHPDIADDQADDLCAAVDSVRQLVLDVPIANPDRYSDGRRVVTDLELEVGNVCRHTWLPDPARNPPNEFRTQTTSGARKRVLIVCDQVLDVIEEKPNLQLVDWDGTDDV